MTGTRYHHGNLRSALLERAAMTVDERGVQALAEDGFERLRGEMERAVEAAGAAFRPRLHALAHAYIAFATCHPALLELMFAGKQREGADAVREAADRSFAVALSAIAEAQAGGELPPGDPGQVGFGAFAMLQGLATMAIGGMIDTAPVDEVVTCVVDQLLDGLTPR